jgi:neopullulanase
MTPVTKPRNFRVVPAPYAEGELLARRHSFSYPCAVKPFAAFLGKLAHFSLLSLFVFLAIIPAIICRPALLHTAPRLAGSAPEVTKIEPPNWWIGLTPQVLLLLYGHDLEATHVSCNLSSFRVIRTQSTAGGDYLFVWLKIGPEARSGTAVCRIMTAAGPASFEVPLAVRSDGAGKFQGLSPREVPYFITPKALADANPGSDKSRAVAGSRDESINGAHTGGDLRQIRVRLKELKNLGANALRLAPLTAQDSDDQSHGAVDFYSIHAPLGSLRDLQDLVASAHEQDMKVILDLDLLHIGDHHPWMSRAPLAEWLGAAANQRGNLSKPSGEPPNAKPVLDTENPLVALYILQSSIWWVETAGLDGIHVVQDPSATNQFWRSWRAGLQKIYPHLAVVGE